MQSWYIDIRPISKSNGKSVQQVKIMFIYIQYHQFLNISYILEHTTSIAQSNVHLTLITTI